MQAANDSMNNIVELFPNKREILPPEKSSLGSAVAWIIWSISAVFVLFQFFLQLTSGVIVDGLMKSFSLSAFGGGVLASAYYYVYVSLQAPAGFLVDHYGTRRLLSIGAAVCGLGCVLFAVSHHVAVALLGRLLMGMGASFAFVGSMNLVSRWFPLRRFGLMAAMAETSGMIGSLFGGYYLAQVVQHVGWRSSMEGAAVIALIMALLLALIVRNAPKGVAPIVPHSKEALWQDVKTLVKKPVVWINGIYSSAIFGIVTAFIALWGIPFMQKAHHLSLSHATLLCNVMFIGIAVSAPLFGWVDGRLHSRRWLMVGSPFLAALLLFILIFDLTLSIRTVVVLMLLLGLVSSSYVLNFVIANEISTPHTRSTSIGLTNMLSVASAPIFQPLIGLILYLLSNRVYQTSIDDYTVGHFQWALSIIPLFVFVAGILGFWLPNRKL